MTGPEAFPLLSSPGRIGPLALRNRMLLCPMGDNLAEPGGAVSDRQLAYYGARADGGAGLLLVGSVGVSASGRTAAAQTGAHLDEHIAGLRRLADRVHAGGAAIAAQLVHTGANAVLDLAEGRPVLVPSPPPRLRMDRLSGMVTPDEMTAMTEPFTRPTASFDHHVATEADLAELIAAYADAAGRLRGAGFDGIEVHAGHGYVIDAFLSPLANQRDDGWGGPVEGRARLLVEVLGAVRDRVGPSMAVWCRLNAREVDKPGGETLDDALVVARLAVAAGADALHVTAYADPGNALGITAAHTPHEPGDRVADAAAVKAAVDVPVITYGRLSPAAAEDVLARGDADLVAFGRKLLAGPDLPLATVAGEPDRARPCAYQYRCIGNIFLHRPLACAANPDTGREDELRPAPADAAVHVLVVGGGPAGLEAAHRLAANGHRVTLWEATDRLGGTLALAGRCDPALAPLVDWLVRRVAETGVTVALGRRATAADVTALAPDRVVIATGAPWSRPIAVTGGTGVDGDGTGEGAGDHGDSGCGAGTASSGRPTVLTIDDLRIAPGHPLDRLVGPVVVLGSGKAAASLAGAARARGLVVALVADGPVVARELGLPGRFRLVHELQAAGVAVHLSAEVTVIDGAGVTLADGTVLPVATVVAAGGRDPSPGSDLADALVAAGLTVDQLGDGTGETGLESAVLGAARLAAALGRPV